MFRIGEFSHIARVTTKLLRFYDRIGLLPPARIDASTGYRYYSAEQLPRLNRILALKELGFSLDEIIDLVQAEVPAAQLREHLATKQARLEAQLAQDQLRLRMIESRIDGIENTEPADAFELRTKTLPPIAWVSHRFACTEPAHAFHIVAQIATATAAVTALVPPPYQLAIGYGDFTDTDVDLQAGVIVRSLPPHTQRLTLPDGTPLKAGTLARVEAITGVRIGLPQLTSRFYAGLGRWLTANNAEINGPVRELFLQVPDPSRGVEPIVEVQFPYPATRRRAIAQLAGWRCLAAPFWSV